MIDVHKKQIKIWFENHSGYMKDWFKRHPGYNARSAKKWREKNPEYHFNVLKKYRKENPEKDFAHGKVNEEVRNGRLNKLPCNVCKEEKVVAHHPDYSKPLDIIWLCRSHHKEIHNNIKER